MVAGWFATGAAMCGFGVLLGAFGAHELKERLAPDMLAVFETGVRYHLFHGLAVMAVAWAAERWPSGLITSAGWLFVAGIIIFSGSLYLYSITGVRWLGAITPDRRVVLHRWLAGARPGRHARSLSGPAPKQARTRQ